MKTDIKILIVDENETRAAILLEGLKSSGIQSIEQLSETQDLANRIFALDPDVILIDLENPNRDVLEQMFQVSREVKRPIAMFVDQSDREAIVKSVDAGVSAYIVDGLKSERVRAIVDTTISRFNAFNQLKKERDEAKTALSERKVIDRAKAIVMKQRGLDEAEAYAMLRKAAMNSGQKIAEIAQSIITTTELLGGDNG